MVLIAGVGAWLGYDQVRQRTDLVLANTSNTDIVRVQLLCGKPVHNLPGMGVELSVPALFGHNVRAVLIIFFAGPSFVWRAGCSVLSGKHWSGWRVLTFFGILGLCNAFMVGDSCPMGMFELPALLLGSAVVLLRFGVALVTRHRRGCHRRGGNRPSGRLDEDFYWINSSATGDCGGSRDVYYPSHPGRNF